MSLILTSIVLFAATNIDDIFLLLTWFSQRDSKLKSTHIIFGQYLGFIALVILSLIGALGALIIPQEWIGLMGVVPIYLGFKGLVDQFRERAEEQQAEREGEAYIVQEASIEETNENPSRIQKFFHPSIYKVATVTFANGGDNIGVYIPFFATYKGWQIGIVVLIFLFLVATWCYIANKLISFPLVAKTLERYGHIIVPFVLIGLGVLILNENGTFSYLIDKLLK
ncbi:cadmium resistance transporter [Rummeliibacillus pycnus]|uniref:cadmium resistance transporter n=1 Tax=Rummeliibacillus pycnus TaxID=101070 RepID=UPI003D27DF9F